MDHVPTTTELLTPRLRLRRWVDADAAPLDALNADPEVTRLLTRAAGPGFHRAAEAHWAEHGIGPWAVEERETGTLVGFVGIGYPLAIPDLAHRPELGWRLARSTWGRGYATEAAGAARDHALGPAGLRSLVSIIHPLNHRSLRVAAKLGLRLEGRARSPHLNRDVEVWSVSRETHAGSHPPGQRAG